ncbi:hypothetical protein SZ00_03263 [Rhodococcus sp. AD45]|nr:hypothetical protein SZ00_03263 [Rhodococcus sp. AD45]
MGCTRGGATRGPAAIDNRVSHPHHLRNHVQHSKRLLRRPRRQSRTEVGAGNNTRPKSRRGPSAEHPLRTAHRPHDSRTPPRIAGRRDPDSRISRAEGIRWQHRQLGASCSLIVPLHYCQRIDSDPGQPLSAPDTAGCRRNRAQSTCHHSSIRGSISARCRPPRSARLVRHHHRCGIPNIPRCRLDRSPKTINETVSRKISENSETCIPR